jgi:hypothetical protein
MPQFNHDQQLHRHIYLVLAVLYFLEPLGVDKGLIAVSLAACYFVLFRC